MTLLSFIRVDGRLKSFLGKAGREAQRSLLIGPHFADLSNLVEHCLPKPSLDYISGQVTELLMTRPDRVKTAELSAAADGGGEKTALSGIRVREALVR